MAEQQPEVALQRQLEARALLQVVGAAVEELLLVLVQALKQSLAVVHQPKQVQAQPPQVPLA